MTARSLLMTAAYTPPSPPTLDLSFMTPGSLDARITFARASTATYFDVTGTLQTAATNAPRWDYDPVTHVLKGLLVEEARTNLLLNSATLVTQSVTVSAVAYTLSFYGTGTVTLSGTSSGVTAGTGASTRVSTTFTPTAGSLTLTISGTVTNAQLEAGAIPTSYIPTTGAAATRAVDSATMPWAASVAYAFVVQALLPAFGQAPVFAQLDDGTTANRLSLSASATGALTIIEAVAATLTVSNAGGGQITAGAPFKAGVTSSSGQKRGTLNGGAQTAGVNVANAPSVTTLKLGRAVTNTVSSFYLQRLSYWPQALSVTELQSVTS